MMLRVALLVVTFLLNVQAHAFSFFTNYGKKSPEDVVKILQQKQVDDPNNPQVNYNLGVALYKVGDYQAAQRNFKRAVEYGKDTISLRKRCYFNLAGSHYQYALKILGPKWDGRTIDDKIIDNAIMEAQGAVEHYGNVLVLDKEDASAQENKKLAEDLLQQLQQKKMKQQQDSNDNKDQKNQGEQDKQQQKSDNQSSQKDKKPQQDQQKNNQSGGNQEQNNKQQGQDKNQQGDNQQGGGQQDKQDREQKGQDNQQHPEQGQGDGSNQDQQQEQKQAQGRAGADGSDKRQGENEQQEGVRESESNPDNQNNEEGKGFPGGVGQQYQAGQEDSFSKRQARAVLDNLEQHEADLQKQIIYRNIHNRQQRHMTNQKPW